MMRLNIDAIALSKVFITPNETAIDSEKVTNSKVKNM